MAVFFKDFGKETKDLLTKNTAEGKGELSGAGFAPLVWKAESKAKLKKGDCCVVNPVCDAKGVVVNIEHNCKFTGAKVKLELNQALGKSKPTVTPFDQDGRKVEVGVASFDNYKAYNVTYEDKQKAYSAIVKVDGAKKTISVENSLPVAAGIAAGGSIDMGFGGGFSVGKWNAGVRYAACKSCVASVTTAAAKSFNLAASGDVPGVKLEGKPLQAGASIDFVLASKAFKATIGVSGKVPMCPLGSSFKAKLDTAKNFSVSHCVDVGCWKLACTYDLGQRAFGLLVTSE